MRIVFMGTPDFAVRTLEALITAGHDVAAVVTMPDKPAGRGQKLQQSAVKCYAVEHNLPVLQPERLKEESFVNALRELKADVQVVVAFRMLPEIVWNMPPMGTYNVHASLLPQYRGAAPINWAIMNGDSFTGVTTFKLCHEIDTGDIALQQRVDITNDDNAGTLHDKLMEAGASLAVETLSRLDKGTLSLTSQSILDKDVELRPAPKIFKDDMRIDWKESATTIWNKIRGLSPYPAAWTEMPAANGDNAPALTAKIFAGHIAPCDANLCAGEIESDGKSYLRFATGEKGLSIEIDEIQLAGKKRMAVKAMLQGYHF
ncbi:MAG: methionyl-tRNA formyltransferase [Marinilabiliaceae bacterium]|nr:methionyl-tRNA formyltransferase [Marinilabiliaceae bacterium]